MNADAFHLPGERAAKNDPKLIADDERHFAAIATHLEQTIRGLSERLDAARKAPGGHGQEALDRDQEIHRLTARLRVLRRFGLDLCLGRMIYEDDPEPVYIGRVGLTDEEGRRLLLDWRAPAAEPFFGATHARPMGLASRRRYRWTRGRITDYWDEVFTAVGLYERPPAEGMTVETHWSEIRLEAEDWAEAFAAAGLGVPHNEAREQAWEELLATLIDRHDGDVPEDLLRRSLLQNRELVETFSRAWPLIRPTDLVGDLWTVPAYLRMCAPWLTEEEAARLQRDDAQAWTAADLPLLDAARRRLGDLEAARRRRRGEAAVAALRERMDDVVHDLIEADDSDMYFMSMLRGADLQEALLDEAPPAADPDLLAGPFSHIVVDEAQELTDAEWQMLLSRCPARSFTVVGDRAQARRGFPESWTERLERIGLEHIESASLSINYRTPKAIMEAAEEVIRAALPDANVPTSVRTGGAPVRYGTTSELRSILDTWIDEHEEGTACVIGNPDFPSTARVRSLTPELTKGLEFDLVVLIEPESFGAGVEGAVDRYVAMTRATGALVVLTDP